MEPAGDPCADADDPSVVPLSIAAAPTAGAPPSPNSDGSKDSPDMIDPNAGANSVVGVCVRAQRGRMCVSNVCGGGGGGGWWWLVVVVVGGWWLVVVGGDQSRP